MTYTLSLLSPIGRINITASDVALLSVLFTKEDEVVIEDHPNSICLNTLQQLEAYFAGKRQVFDLPLKPQGTAFQQQVWDALVQVPFGKTGTYSAIAHKLNNPLSVRAVGAANGRNPIAIIIPCHRIIGADGSLTGYAGGLWRKEFLLNLEGARKAVQPTLW